MGQLYNIYCDESCHLESPVVQPENRFMVLGGISCPDNLKKEIFGRLKDIRAENGLTARSEMKWTKVARGKLNAYKDMVNYFFDRTDLCFRCVVIDKTQLNHDAFGQSHDDFYYKMYWQMLEWFIEPSNSYRVYLDLKDTQGVHKIAKLHDVLCNSHHDFNQNVINRLQEVRSHEIILLQLADILLGAISYANRYPNGGASAAKNELVNLIRLRSKVSLQRSTSLGARKFNIFRWEGQR